MCEPFSSLAGFCELAGHIPCADDCERKPGGCAVSCGVMAARPLPHVTDPRLLGPAVAALCDAAPSCVAFGLYSKMYELYNKSSSALAPVANSQWTLFYRNGSCTLPGAQSACAAPAPPPPRILPPDVFSASQELLQARVNASMGSHAGAECGTVTSTAVMVRPQPRVSSQLFGTCSCVLPAAAGVSGAV